MDGSPPVLTTDLALRIEALFVPEPGESGPIVQRFGRTIASKTTHGRPLNDVFGFGPEDLGQLDAILAFYAADGLNPHFCLAPMGFSPEVGAALNAAGFVQSEFSQAILYGVPVDAPAPPPGVTIERTSVDTLHDFATVTAEGFGWDPAWRDMAIAGLKRSFRPDAHHLLARVDGRPAGVATLDLRGEAAILTDSAVVPVLRGRGVHLALIRHRLHTARALGCTLIVGAATFGSASFRNQQRAGLRLAYIESGWTRAT
jgi:GNAT superfamily N-acetyltransferase